MGLAVTQLLHYCNSLVKMTKLNRHGIACALIILHLPPVQPTGGEDDLKASVKPFDGVVSSFTPWLIAFTALIAW